MMSNTYARAVGLGMAILLALGALWPSWSGSGLGPTPARASATQLFSDGFESGSFSAWSPGATTGGDGAATVQGTTVHSGSDAVHITTTSNTGSKAYVRQTLSSSQTDLTVDGWFNIGAANSTSPLIRLFSGSGTLTRQVSLYTNASNQLNLDTFDGTTHTFTSLGKTETSSTWFHINMHVSINTGTPANSTVVVAQDGLQTYSGTLNVGSNAITTVQLGQEVTAVPMNVYADDITVTTAGPQSGGTAAEFNSGFESGSFSSWNTGATTGGDGTATVQSTTKHAGTYAAELKETANTGSLSYVREALPASETELTVSGWYNLASDTSTNTPLMRLFVSSTRLVNLYVASSNQIWVGYNGNFFQTTGTLATGTWSNLRLHVIVNGTSSTVQVTKDGTSIYNVTNASLGTSAISTIQIGQEVSAQPFHAYYDDIYAIGPSAIKTVFLIPFENINWSDVKGDTTDAPYINNTLLPEASYATEYKTPAGNHPSLPNYLWLEAGQCFYTNLYCGVDNSPSTPLTSTAHLVTQLNLAGISWKTYAENLSDTGSTCPSGNSANVSGFDVGYFAVRHVAPLYFSDVTSDSTYCSAHVKDYSAFTGVSGDLATGAIGAYNIIVPNICDDMHGDTTAHTNFPSDPSKWLCPTASPFNQNNIKDGDTWLSNNLPAILSSSAYTNGGLVIITWDEGGSGGDGPIGMIVLSPEAKGSGYWNTIPYTHGSTLRTVEEILGVPNLADAGSQTDLSDLFTTFP